MLRLPPPGRFLSRLVVTAILIGGWLGSGSSLLAQTDAGWDFTPKPIARIPSGTVVGGETVQGWSHPVNFVQGSLSQGDLDAVSDQVELYAKMFNLVTLANVVRQADGSYVLDKVAIGFSTKIKGQDVIITRDTHSSLGANLGMIGGMVFSANEAALKEVKQTARYSNGLILDGPILMFANGRHEYQMARYFFWVSKTTGELGTLVWAMQDQGGDRYLCTSDHMELLPSNMREIRHMHVDGDEFMFGFKPSKKAFAVVQLPQGTPVPFTDPLKEVATLKTFNQATYVELLKLVSQSVHAAPVAQQ